jgi:hypothetical protein
MDRGRKGEEETLIEGGSEETLMEGGKIKRQSG